MYRVAMLSMHGCPVSRLGGKDTGGMNVYVLQIARELGARGHSVDVYTRTHDPDDPQVVHLGDNARVIHLSAGPFDEAKESPARLHTRVPATAGGVPRGRGADVRRRAFPLLALGPGGAVSRGVLGRAPYHDVPHAGQEEAAGPRGRARVGASRADGVPRDRARERRRRLHRPGEGRPVPACTESRRARSAQSPPESTSTCSGPFRATRRGGRWEYGSPTSCSRWDESSR